MANENVPQSSIAVYTPTECTVQFTRWTAHGRTAYLAGQRAGFSAKVAHELVRRGAAVLVQDTPAAARAVRK